MIPTKPGTCTKGKYESNFQFPQGDGLPDKQANEDSYRRALKAVSQGDETMKPLVDWHEGNRPPQRGEFFCRLRDLIREAKRDGITPKQIKTMIGNDLTVATIKQVAADARGIVCESSCQTVYYRLRKALGKKFPD